MILVSSFTTLKQRTFAKKYTTIFNTKKNQANDYQNINNTIEIYKYDLILKLHEYSP